MVELLPCDNPKSIIPTLCELELDKKNRNVAGNKVEFKCNFHYVRTIVDILILKNCRRKKCIENPFSIHLNNAFFLLRLEYILQLNSSLDG